MYCTNLVDLLPGFGNNGSQTIQDINTLRYLRLSQSFLKILNVSCIIVGFYVHVALGILLYMIFGNHGSQCPDMYLLKRRKEVQVLVSV